MWAQEAFMPQNLWIQNTWRLSVLVYTIQRVLSMKSTERKKKNTSEHCIFGIILKGLGIFLNHISSLVMEPLETEGTERVTLVAGACNGVAGT